MLAIALLSVVVAQADSQLLQQLQQTFQAWRNEPSACAVSTQVVIHEGEREGVAMAEPCVIGWDARRACVGLRQGGLSVVVQGSSLRAAHDQGDSAVDRAIGRDAVAAWRECFTEMPWPQPGLVLADPSQALRVFDPEIGDLQVSLIEVGEGDSVTAHLIGPRGTWKMTFRGRTHPKLIDAQRCINSGPRVGPTSRMTWNMRFEHVEMEQGVMEAPIQGRRRVDRVEDVMPAKKKPDATAAPTPP